ERVQGVWRGARLRQRAGYEGALQAAGAGLQGFLQEMAEALLHVTHREALVLAVAGLLVAGACAPQRREAAVASNAGGEASVSMSKEQAIDAARRFASSQGRAVDHYDAEARPDGGGWAVDFWPNASVPKPSPGDHFTVTIDAHGQAQLHPGA